MKSETSLEKKTDKKAFSRVAFENDLIVRIPPVKEASIKVKVKSIEKATPRIIEPEEL